MRVSLDFSTHDLANFDFRCEAAIRNVFKGTKKATTKACEEILEHSKSIVPVDTGTLRKSAFYEVSKRTDIASSSFEAVIGYGGNGDPINPASGERASHYMLDVHEDLSVYHKKGQAKFLEVPVRAYAQRNFKRVLIEETRDALEEMID